MNGFFCYIIMLYVGPFSLDCNRHVHKALISERLAFSRDTPEKTYVRHLLWERRAAVWDWIQQGAYLYVCGDATKMAKDVEATILRIGADQGRMIEEDSRAWLKGLRKERRYLQDVY